MTSLTIVGGLYRERCIWPNWDRVLGSGGRAAETASGLIDEVQFHAYASNEARDLFQSTAQLAHITFHPVPSQQRITFSYIHSLSTPLIEPPLAVIRQETNPIAIEADAILRFGMLEGDAVVKAKRCVYDPQSAFQAQGFGFNGSAADALAIVANIKEIRSLAPGAVDDVAAAQSLLVGPVEVVVIKSGVGGAVVVDREGVIKVPAYQTQTVFKIGSGDVFAATFAAHWASLERPARDAAFSASRAVARYVESMALPVAPETSESSMLAEAIAVPGRAFIAGPSATMGQRWVVDEARRCLLELGLHVLSPLHDVGISQAAQQALPDVGLLAQSDRVFAVFDGIDNRSLFAVGWARKHPEIPVYLYAQSASEEDLRMARSANCRIFDDFVTALYHTAWKL